MTSVGPPDMGGPISEACQAYAALYDRCYGPGYADIYQYCVEYVQYIEDSFPECVALFEEFIVCLSALDCETLQGPGAVECEPILNVYYMCQEGA